jgi:hypothetical protein
LRSRFKSCASECSRVLRNIRAFMLWELAEKSRGLRISAELAYAPHEPRWLFG